MDFKNFKPCFLIAMPELEDPNFKKAVILLTDYNEKGASGFVINRETNIVLGDTIVLDDSRLNPDYEDLHLWYGGPVDPEKIWIVYDSRAHSNPKDTKIGENIMIAHDIIVLTNHEKTINKDLIRIFHGYSGWGAKQLDNELMASTWLTAPLSHDLLFNTEQDKIWKTAITKLGFDPNKLIGSKSSFLN